VKIRIVHIDDRAILERCGGTRLSAVTERNAVISHFCSHRESRGTVFEDVALASTNVGNVAHDGRVSASHPACRDEVLWCYFVSAALLFGCEVIPANHTRRGTGVVDPVAFNLVSVHVLQCYGSTAGLKRVATFDRERKCGKVVMVLRCIWTARTRALVSDLSRTFCHISCSIGDLSAWSIHLSLVSDRQRQ
jgi:hypothetical protein